jgi:hypothetical protein
MANRKHDYDSMEADYIASDDIPMRQIAIKYGMTNYSMVTSYAKAHKWAEKRALRKAKTDEKVMERSADRMARRYDRLEDAFDATVDLIVESIEKVRRDMRETPEKVNIAPRDLALLIDRLLVMKGQPSQITEERNLGLSLSGPVRSDQLAAILELTSGVSVHQRNGPGGSAIPRSEDARNN